MHAIDPVDLLLPDALPPTGEYEQVPARHVHDVVRACELTLDRMSPQRVEDPLLRALVLPWHSADAATRERYLQFLQLGAATAVASLIDALEDGSPSRVRPFATTIAA